MDTLDHATTGQRQHRPGFIARRRRLRNRWNVQMRKDDRAREKARNQNSLQATSLPQGPDAGV